MGDQGEQKEFALVFFLIYIPVSCLMYPKGPVGPFPTKCPKCLPTPAASTAEVGALLVPGILAKVSITVPMLIILTKVFRVLDPSSGADSGSSAELSGTNDSSYQGGSSHSQRAPTAADLVNSESIQRFAAYFVSLIAFSLS